MFRVKICGITNPQDALAAAEAGADAIGLNFYSGSKRHVRPEQAVQIVQPLPERVARVGVFVNASLDEVRQTARDIGLNWVQLHGDETPDYLFSLGLRIGEPRIIKAFRMDLRGTGPIAEYLQCCHETELLPQAILVDAHRAGQYGGTGQTVDWASLAAPRDWALGTPLILAGGLTADNIAAAIAAAKPEAVDTASGVEFAPGQKDVMLMDKFAAAAKTALGNIA